MASMHSTYSESQECTLDVWAPLAYSHAGAFRALHRRSKRPHGDGDTMAEIRNFSIIAHIDHGKSTLADRLIQRAGLVPDRLFRDQMLDNLDVERERGITIKSQTINLPYTSKDGKVFDLNLIDTPGHADFSYEVSRALASCEGVLLLVDASQGVQAQTVANLYMAMEHDLAVIAVVNKIDLASADIERSLEQIDAELGLDPQAALLCSAREGTGVEQVLEAIAQRVPAPRGDAAAPLQGLIFDAHYDQFRGAVIHCRVFNGTLRAGDTLQLMSSGKTFRVEEVGVFRLAAEPRPALSAGMVGYVIAGIKTVRDTRVGDTLTLHDRPCASPLPGFKDSKPVVFSSMYPIQTDDYPSLSDALDRYKLNDAAFVYEKDSSAALGQGFRCGFLGLLHIEVVQERLEREFGQSLILTAPSVEYHVNLTSGATVNIDNPAHYPDAVTIESVEEPYIKTSIFLPDRYVGAVMKLCMNRRGVNSKVDYHSRGRVDIQFDMPLAEVIFDFYDRLKSITQGYGSFDYELIDYRLGDVVKLDILVNGDKVDALSMIVHRERARQRALNACEKLQQELPRQQFKIAIQGAIGGHIIARTTVNAYRKDVTAKCYGGDISRKRKLLEKQKEGKKRMKMVGSVEIPQSAFVAVLKSDDE
jgi:GTP-binding protein LepA